MRANGKTLLIQRNWSNRLSRMSDIVVHRTGPSDMTCCTPDEGRVSLPAVELDEADAGGELLDREPGAIFGGAA